VCARWIELHVEQEKSLNLKRKTRVRYSYLRLDK